MERTCLMRAQGTQFERYAPALCTCAAASMMRHFNSVQLVALSLHVAPKRVKDEEDRAMRLCAVAAIAPRFRAPAPAVDRCTHEASEVRIALSGPLKDASIYRSSGNRDVDAAAVKAARASTYAPKVRSCRPVEGRYLFRADFDPD